MRVQLALLPSIHDEMPSDSPDKTFETNKDFLESSSLKSKLNKTSKENLANWLNVSHTKETF